MIVEIDKSNLEEFNHSFIEKDKIQTELENNPFGKILGLKDKNEIIGYLYYSDIYDRVEINQFEIEKFHRNCGKGQLLLSYLIEKVQKDITLEVKEDNLPAIHLYEKNGFIKKAIRQGYYNGIDGILMERKESKAL